MESYFIRHTNKLAIDSNEINEIWQQDKIAIHFPDVPQNNSDKADSKSLDPNDYEIRADGNVVRRFVDLAKNGGYIWANYLQQNVKTKIGMIKPGSRIEFWKAKWTNPEYKPRLGKTAILKTLKLQCVKKVKPYEAMSFKSTFPRQGTFSKWPSVGRRLEVLIKGKKIKFEWANLSPSQQEIVCSEFLRYHDMPDYPRLKYLLMPPGRTLKDIDIYGCTEDRKEIFAQVKFSEKSKFLVEIDKLRQYGNKRNCLIFFCKCESFHTEKGILFIPVQQVFDWLNSKKKYVNKLSLV